MSKQLYLYDTTLRDGAQYKGMSFSLEDKLKISRMLDQFGVDYIEGGWPGSNPKDEAYFSEMSKRPLSHAKLVAFGSTKKPYLDVIDDQQIQQLLNANTPAVALVSKFWIFHIEEVLRTEPEENLQMIHDSVAFFKANNREVILDAEHFFDGYKENQDYTFQCLKYAIKAGVDNVTLCDTNGGTMPQEIFDIVRDVKKHFPEVKLGIHCHNDCEIAVANSLQSVNAGTVLIQGTINGYGERCGNANLIPIIASLALKDSLSSYFFNPKVNSKALSKLAHDVANIANIPLAANAAYVGENAFSHKGGIHVAAIEKASETYEHVPPATVGAERNITISELSGRSNVQLQANKLGLNVSRNFKEILNNIKLLEKSGLTLENASGSFEMLVRKHDKTFKPHFTILSIHINTSDFTDSLQQCTASVKLQVRNRTSFVVTEAKGPVDALYLALKKALLEFYPHVEQMRLTDYKVSIIDPERASAATTRVWIQSGFGNHRWATVGCSDNIITASTQALIDSYELFLIKHKPIHFEETEV